MDIKTMCICPLMSYTEAHWHVNREIHIHTYLHTSIFIYIYIYVIIHLWIDTVLYRFLLKYALANVKY